MTTANDILKAIKDDNDEDIESRSFTCRGLVPREDITSAANWRAPAICVHNSSKADILRPAQPRSAEPAR